MIRACFSVEGRYEGGSCLSRKFWHRRTLAWLYHQIRCLYKTYGKMLTIHANGSEYTLNPAPRDTALRSFRQPKVVKTPYLGETSRSSKKILDLFFCKCKSAPLDILRLNLRLKARPIQYIIPQGKDKDNGQRP